MSAAQRYWHVANSTEVWSSDGDAPIAVCKSTDHAHGIVAEHNAALSADAIARRLIADALSLYDSSASPSSAA